MWTPKRVLLLVVGFVLFLAGFVVYSRYLGGIDGLPALPEMYWPHLGDPPIIIIDKNRPNELEQKLIMAFGKDCPELGYALKFQVRSKGMVLAAKSFQIDQETGKVKLETLSVATFGKHTPEGKFPEINTIRGQVAYLTFDHRITNPADMAKYKIVEAELFKDIEIINNRKTPERDDDLSLTTQGPIYYKEADHHIWTANAVEIIDLQSKPDPTKINAVGMDLWLATEASAPPKPDEKAAKKAAPPKPRSDSISGVERVLLRQDVDMHLYLDGKSGFLATGKSDKDKKEEKKAPAIEAEGDPQPAKRDHVHIHTQGPFNYDVEKMHAQFDVSQQPSPYPNRVEVHRFNLLDDGRSDELDCERLELQFQPHQEEGAKAVKDDRSLDLEIQSAHATGTYVTLKSDADSLDAFGNDFYYDALTGQSTLKGGPMQAVKQGNEIIARELIMVQQKGVQEGTALGPGEIHLFDRQPGKPAPEQPVRQAFWTDKLIFGKDGNQDLLVLTGQAAFQDNVANQRLQADVLRVWLEPEDPKVAAAKAAGGDKPAGPDSATQGRRPSRVEATGHVVLRSPDLNARDAERLDIFIKDAPPPGPGTAPVAGAPAGQPAGEQLAARPTDPPAVPTPAFSTSEPPLAPLAPGTPAPGASDTTETKPASKPLNLSARVIRAHVLRTGQKSELDQLWTEGNVVVHQDPATPEDRGVDIKGETMQMTRKPLGNYLVVTAPPGPPDRKELAWLQLNKISLAGPVVHIDQDTNKAWVEGLGMMEMVSESSLQGGKLKKPELLKVVWNDSMFFDGRIAEFHGGVMAEQEHTGVLCQSMQVFLDRPVSLKEGDKSLGTTRDDKNAKNGDKQPAKVRNLSCTGNVCVIDQEWDDQGNRIKYQRLDCPDLSVDNEQNTMWASGPGVVRLLQLGDDDPENDPTAPPPSTKPGAPKPTPKQEMKFTRVKYAGRMYANNNTHTATFTDQVDVINVPSTNPDENPNPDKLPEGGFAIKCDRLEVYSRRIEDEKSPLYGKSSQIMIAKKHTFFNSKDVSGTADKVTYEQDKDKMIFDGGDGGMATLYKDRGPGLEKQKMKGKKIEYFRKTKIFNIIGGTEATGG
jgi:hypothetical protein